MMDANYKKIDYATIFCDKCDYSCRRKDEIELHHSTKHEGFRFKCTKCKAEYQTRASLSDHIKAEHEGVRYKCDKCDFAAKNKNNLRNHKIVHKKERKKFSCTICTRTYLIKHALTRHIRTKHDKIGIKCDKCSYVESTEKRMNVHAKKHEKPLVKKPEKVTKLIPCNKCEEEFPTKMKLALHVGASHFHADEKYPCHLCEFETNSIRVLKNHIIDHMKHIKDKVGE